MDRAARPGEEGRLRRLRRLINATIVATFALIIVGGVVRVSDSGLGCGTAGNGLKGWPLCGGRALPLINERAIIEFSHRALATVVVVLILAIIWRAYSLRGERLLWRGSLLAAFLVFAQAGLGGLTVQHNLNDLLVAAHLVTAMLLLGTLITLSWMARPRADATSSPPPNRGLRSLAGLATLLLLATIAAGGYVAGTEDQGVTGGVSNGAHLACGTEFPGCLGGFLPFGQHGRLVDIQLAHRALVYGTSLALLALFGLALYRRSWSRQLTLLALLLVVQVTLGAMNIWLGKHPGLVVAHLTAATLLYCTALITTLSLSPQPAPRRLGAPAEPEGEPLPA